MPLDADALQPKDMLAIVKRHDLYWDPMRNDMRRYMAAYETKFWHQQERDNAGVLGDTLVVETSRGYEYIETHVASLFSHSPAVEAKEDMRGRGDKNKQKGLVNAWFLRTRTVNEDTSRLALILPCAFVKLEPLVHKNLYKRVKKYALMPWDVIVDDEASSWDSQRYVCHRHWVPLRTAKAKWGDKKWKPGKRILWQDAKKGHQEDIPDSDTDYHKWVQVIEVYDLQDDRLLIWSEQYENGEKWVYDGVEVMINTLDGEKKTKVSKLPFRTADDEYVLNIIPLYYSRLPYNPMRGYSAMRRVYDQTVELNVTRTFQANAVRKCARQWLARAGVFDDIAKAKISRGRDGEIIEVDLPGNRPLEGNMIPVPHTPVPLETYRYAEAVQSDWDRGAIMAPFTRGQPLGGRTSATEAGFLAQYSSTEIGRMARERDAALEAEASAYIAMLRTYMGDDGKDHIVVDGEAVVVKAKDLDGDMFFFAQDGGSTPVAEQQKKQEFPTVVDLGMKLGVAVEHLRAEFVRIFRLPKAFLNDTPPPAPDKPVAPPPMPAETVVPGGQPTAGGTPLPEGV